MQDSENPFDCLRRRVLSDPVLQARLFGIEGVNDFIAALLEEAQAMDMPMDRETLQQALSQGRRAWLQKDVLWT